MNLYLVDGFWKVSAPNVWQAKELLEQYHDLPNGYYRDDQKLKVEFLGRDRGEDNVIRHPD